ncbi:hypothetical protein Trydic_g22280 [Trypoxylus dichotomus]
MTPCTLCSITKLHYATLIEITLAYHKYLLGVLVYANNLSLSLCLVSQFAEYASCIISASSMDQLAEVRDIIHEQLVHSQWSFTKWQEDWPPPF